jgi:imidazolonepropionase
MAILLKNIKQLLQVREASIQKVSGKEMKLLPKIDNAYLVMENGLISDFGPMSQLPDLKDVEEIDCTDRFVLPSWCDSHTHIVYAGNREQEFVDRINGLSYEEIANKGGGIVNSAEKLQQISEEDLYQQSAKRLEQVMALGTGAVEIKSGYGLTTDAELKMLRVIKQLKEHYNIPIKATFLGAHALPKEFKGNKQGYLNLIVDEILPKIAEQQLADYIDIFCEKGYFDLDDTNFILSAGKSYGLTPKVHVNQFNAIGGVKASVAQGALSVDHLEVITSEDIDALKNSATMPVALPSCSLFLSIPYTPARELIDADLPLALATDFNPGSTPSGNMNLVVSLASIKMNMTPEEAINAATLNGAYAMGLSEEVGSITRGKKANVIVTNPIPSYGYLPYSFGENCIASVFVNGKIL